MCFSLLLFLRSAQLWSNIYTYLECGSIRGEPNGVGGDGADWRLGGAVLAMSGCRKFRRCSTLSWCWRRHLERTSGSRSNCSFYEGEGNYSLLHVFLLLFIFFDSSNEYPFQCVTHNLWRICCASKTINKTLNLSTTSVSCRLKPDSAVEANECKQERHRN